VADFYPVAGVVAFVVDAADPSFRKAAEFLYDIFSNAKFNDVAPKMMIACNKSDVSGAASVDAVRAALEKELTKLKKTRSSLETEGDDDTSTVPVGRDGVAFEFATDAPCEVTFTKCSVKNGDMDELATFLLKN
jgi:signal recognition particle receptor subunit beta